MESDGRVTGWMLRYSDWYGRDRNSGSAITTSVWRDWIIESLNSGIGYNQLIVEMSAADEAAPEDPNALRATGFLVRNWDASSRNKWLDMTIEHTSRAFLGITMQCARCHDHKFDPIAQAIITGCERLLEPIRFGSTACPVSPIERKTESPEHSTTIMTHPLICLSVEMKICLTKIRS